ncbi:MAG: flavin-binding protein [Sphingomonadaceae bacterium]|nr:flavin-binding protein [Sphingomonadaceae bacterium]
MFDTLTDIWTDIDARLSRAALDRTSPMHTPVVATADADVRIMVLRSYDSATQSLRFHTDARAPKAHLIGDGAPVGVLFYDKAAKVQIRCKGTGRIEQYGPTADAAWADSNRFARRCYLGAGPGASSSEPSSGLPPAFEGVEPNDDDLLPARENFAVLHITLQSVDWFHLAHTGHRRAIFEGGEGRWVAP